MSCNYTRLMKEPAECKMYGFQRVSPQEMKSLIMRMQKPTHSSDIGGYFPDGYFKHPHRPTSGLCKRATPTDEELGRLTPRHGKRGMPPKQMNQLLRRLQTPTISRLAAEGAIIPDFDISPRSSEVVRPKTGEERSKFLRRITRPTTASKRKDMDSYWHEAVNSEFYDVDFSEDNSASKEEIEGIVDRVRAPTVASLREEEMRCPKRRASVQVDRDKLPLVSGLARSKRVEDIVERLYRPNTSSSTRKHSAAPASTRTTSTSSGNR